MNIWLTVNRKCNFRCLWCYAKSTQYHASEDMTLETSQRLISIGLGNGVKEFILLGGEPTFWPYLKITCLYLTRHDAKVSIVTNGWLFASMDYAKEIQTTGAEVNISLKASNRTQYRKLTRVDAYDKTIRAIRNLAKLEMEPSVSITASALVMDNIEELVKVATDNEAARVTIEFCCTTFDGNKPQQGYMLTPRVMADKLMAKYELMHKYSNGNLGIMQTLPFCLFPNEFIETLEEREQIMSGCHVTGRSGIIFTHDGTPVLPCNCLYGFPIGKLDKDFTDAETFEEFWRRKEVVKANEDLVCYPHLRCTNCIKYDKCCGGCPLQWFVFNPKNVTQERENVDVQSLNQSHYI